jgi:2-methylaconitate cis-trans-isomerase PrpF
MTLSVPCAIIRGGTSKGVFFLASDLPADPAARDDVVLRVFGSPDIRQIDGLGGADPLTSKCVIVSPSAEDGFDIDYRFGQVAIDRALVDYHSVCGNLSSALGYFALLRGLVVPMADVTVTRVRIVGSPGSLVVETPTGPEGAYSHGDFSIDGVPGSGARVTVDLGGLAGAALGSAFPTGNRTEELVLPDGSGVEVSLMDVGNPHCFVEASSLGLSGTESPAEIEGTQGVLEMCEAIRGAAAVRMGMADSPADALAHTPSVPILSIVAPPTTGSRANIVARLAFMQRIHKTYAVTATVCTAVAVRAAGTLAHRVAKATAGDVLIGHPRGLIACDAEVSEGAELDVRRAAVYRTARVLMDGRAFL